MLADALEISPPTLYRWLRHYFKMSFTNFKRLYILGRWQAWVQPVDFREHHLAYAQVKPFDFRSLGPGRERPDRGNSLPTVVSVK